MHVQVSTFLLRMLLLVMVSFTQSYSNFQQSSAANSASTLMMMNKQQQQSLNTAQTQQQQQQQQVQQIKLPVTSAGVVGNTNQFSASNSPNIQVAQGDTNKLVSQKANLAIAKSNHRLVSKLKDARHRRRHRHQRHRHHYHKKVNSELGLATTAESPPVLEAATSSSTLSTLESIVEEVARVGQMNSVGQQQPATQQVSSNQQQQPGSAAQSQQSPALPTSNQVSSAMNAVTEILLDGSSSPISHLQPISAQQSPAQQLPGALIPVLTIQPQQNQPSRLPQTYNSRGFFLTSMLSKIMNVLNVTEFALEMRDGISSRASCMACNAVVGLFLSPLYSKDVFSVAIRTVCTSFKIQPARVCAGLVESFQDDFEFIRKNTKLTRDEVCAVVFGVDCARRQTYNLFWTIPIPDASFTTSSSQQTNYTSSGLSSNLPLNEQSLSNMEDAPDLFEYRKLASFTSNTQADHQLDQSSLASSSSAVSASPSSLPSSSPSSSSSSSSSSLSGATTTTTNEKKNQASSGGSGGEALLKGKLGSGLKTSSSSEEYIFSPLKEEDKDKLSSFVHITDIHVDPYYEPGSLNDCNEPLCCRATSGPVPVGDKRRQAGRWGDYGNCDTPIRTIRHALNRIRSQHSNAEYWIWTGDISPHDIWNITKSEAANNVRLVSKMIREYSNGLPVFPVIGNHEAHPVNSFSPPEIKGKFSMSWLYEQLAEEWSVWLPKQAIKTLRVGGYYKLQVRKGFRIIALNTNYCARLNPWSFYDPVDPANQLKWLVDELLEAELNQDKVHIIGHVPPDNRECTQAWLFNFINIIDRFKDTVVAQFYGHTHRDEWRVMYSLKRNDDPIGIQYIGPSITPFTENNPAYRVYHQDQTGHLIDSHTYFFNLTEANETPTTEPNWKFSYSTQKHLNMTRGLTAYDWHHYVQRLHEDQALFDSFFKNYYRSSDVKLGQVCKNKCKYQMLSDLRLSHPYKTKPKPFLANRKTSNHHHRDHHHHHKRLRHLE